MNATIAMHAESLAPLFEYPTPGYQALVDACLAGFEDIPADGFRADEHPLVLLKAFAAGVRGLPLEELEELYTRTFDLNPTCALDIGWHLYGEQYQRGDFLVTLRTALREHNIAEDTELPDHLPSVLRLLARTEEEAAMDLARSAVSPAIEKMLTAFSDEGNPFRSLLVAVRSLLQSLHPQPTGEDQHD